MLPRLCVSTEGAVESIQLVTKTPLERVRSVAVTPESATSVVLTKVLFPEAEHVPLGEDAEAKLLIGHAALRPPSRTRRRTTTSAGSGSERTDLPMVSRVWAAPRAGRRRAWPSSRTLSSTSVRRARAEPEQLAYESSERYGYPAGFLARYFEKLRYRFGPRERAGLFTFLEMARDVGELGEVPELRFVHDEVPA